MNEEFRIITCNPTYSISNYGRVKHNVTGHVLKLHKSKSQNNSENSTFYYRVTLWSKDYPKKKHLVHRLVASAFLPNKQLYPEVNHKDRNGLNNCVDNLEWCNKIMNGTHALGKAVSRYNMSNKLIDTFDSASQAARDTKSDVRLISAVCLGKRRYHNNYIWKYQEA